MRIINYDIGNVSDHIGIGSYRYNDKYVTIIFEAYWGDSNNKEGLYFKINMVYDKKSNRSYKSPKFTRKYIPFIREVSHHMRLKNMLGKRY